MLPLGWRVTPSLWKDGILGWVTALCRRPREKRAGLDADLGPQDLLLRFQYSNTHTHGLQWSCGGKGTEATLSGGECLRSPRPLPQGGSTQSLAVTSLYRFFRLLTSKKVLLYYTKACLGWLSFADNREDVTEYIKGGHLQCKRRNGRKGSVPYLEGLAQILGR